MKFFIGNKKYDYTDNFGDKTPKLSRREKARIEKEEEEKSDERNADENVSVLRTVRDDGS